MTSGLASSNNRLPSFDEIGSALPRFEDIQPMSAQRPTKDLADMETQEFPEDLQNIADRARNTIVYSRNLPISVYDAYDYEPQINEALYGKGTTSSAAWKITRNKIAGARRKTIGEAIVHSGINTYQNAQRFVAGFGRMVAETAAMMPKFPWDKSGLGVLDPVIRWLYDIDKQEDVTKFLGDLSDYVSTSIKTSQAEHPEMGYAIDADAGFVETLKQMVTRPENMVQGFVESVPMLLEGALGTMIAGPVGGAVAIGIPLAPAVYQDARASGTGVLPAFAQSIATAGIEAAIEEWTLGKKITLGKNITRILSEKPGRKILWEGVKAGFRGGAEEGSQQFNQNFWRWVFTDRSQKWSEGVQQAVAMGTPLEMIMSGGFAGAGKIGAAVFPAKAKLRLDILRQGAQQSDLNVGQKEELLAELDRVPQIVPDVFGIEETADGQPTGQTAGSEPAAQAAGAGEVAADLAARTQETAPQSGQAQDLWQRLNDPAGFTSTNDDEAALGELYREGLIDGPAAVQEVLSPGTTPTALIDPAVRAPDAKITSARQADLLSYLSPPGRASINSRIKQKMAQALASPKAQDAVLNPEFYVKKVMEKGESLEHEEYAGLTIKLAQLRNEVESLDRSIKETTDETLKDSLDTQLERAETLKNSIIDAMDIGGSEHGRALQIHQLLLDEKLEIRSLERRARKRKKDLTPQDMAPIAKVVEQHNTTSDQIEAMRPKVEAEQAEASLKHAAKRRKGEPDAVRKQRLAKNYARLKELLEAGC